MSTRWCAKLKTGRFEPVDFFVRRAKQICHARFPSKPPNRTHPAKLAWKIEPARNKKHMALDYDPAIIGKVFEETDPVAVSAQEIKDFCTAIGETNPWYTDEEAARKGPYGSLAAPPLFVLTFRNGRHFFPKHSPLSAKGGF